MSRRRHSASSFSISNLAAGAASLCAPKQVYTQIVKATEFYKAEDYHQDFYKKNESRYKFYRWNCGRDQRLEQLWGKKEQS